MPLWLALLMVCVRIDFVNSPLKLSFVSAFMEYHFACIGFLVFDLFSSYFSFSHYHFACSGISRS